MYPTTMPPVPLRVQYYEKIVRVLASYDEVLSSGVAACTRLTNQLLEGSSGESSPHICTLLDAVERDISLESKFLKEYSALNEAFSSLTAWYSNLLDAGSSLQSSMDASAQEELTAGDSEGGNPKLRAAERCFELFGELKIAYSVECTVRACVLGSLLPARYLSAWNATLQSDSVKVGETSMLLPRAMEADREALTIAVATWAVSAHADKTRIKQIVASLEEVCKRA